VCLLFGYNNGVPFQSFGRVKASMLYIDVILSFVFRVWEGYQRLVKDMLCWASCGSVLNITDQTINRDPLIFCNTVCSIKYGQTLSLNWVSTSRTIEAETQTRVCEGVQTRPTILTCSKARATFADMAILTDERAFRLESEKYRIPGGYWSRW